MSGPEPSLRGKKVRIVTDGDGLVYIAFMLFVICAMVGWRVYG